MSRNITAYGNGTVASLANLIAITNNTQGQVVGAIDNAAAVTTAIIQMNLTATDTHFYYVAVDNGTDTAVYRFKFADSNANNAIDTAGEVTSLTHIVTLTGIADVSTLTLANIA